MKKGRIFYGWWIVSACATLNFYIGGTFFYGFGAFFDPIRNTFGWSRTTVSFATSLQRLHGGAAAPIVGFLFDRIGPRRLMLFGVTAIGLGLILLSRIDSLGTFYLTFLLISLGFSTASSPVAMATVANWFIKKRARALGLMVTGFGASGALVPAMVWLISQYGWRETVFFIGIGMWLIGIPLSLVMRHKPEQYGYLPNGEPPESEGSTIEEAGAAEIDFTTREAIRTRAFWLIALTYTIQVMATSAVFVHLITYLSTLDISRQIGGLAVMGMTLFSLIGRLGFGWLGDIRDKRHMLVATLCFQFIGVLILAYIASPWHIIPFLIAFSPGYGGPIPLRPAIIGEYFGRTSFGTIQGIMLAVTVIGSMLGPILAGWVCDVTGSYRPAFLLLALVTLAAIPAILAARRPMLKRG